MKHFQIPIAAAAATLLLAASCSVKENLDVKAEVLDEDATVVNTINVPAVPFKRNGATFLTGSLYSVSSQAPFAVETGFEGDIKLDF